MSGRADPHPDERRARRVLAGGFALILLLLAADTIVGFRSIVSIRRNVASLTDDQFRNVVLIDEIQRAQTAMGTVLHRLTLGTYGPDRVQLEDHVNSIEANLSTIFDRIADNDPDIALWRAVEHASTTLTTATEAILAMEKPGREDIQALLANREHLLTATAQLIRANHARAEATRIAIDRITSRQVVQDFVLLSSCLLVSAICAWLVLRGAGKLYAQITDQAEELTRVSWHLLDRQETLARRLSHELHDELGQSLTALKTNLTRHAASGCTDSAWIADSAEIVRESIRNAHEISQLLRPTILDDFGLESAVSWLCERFEDRNDIVVTFTSHFHERLDPQAETHVFRIAQEALTNVARHARASRVDVRLSSRNGRILLSIRDDGVGLPAGAQENRRFGLTGMKARAATLRGVMSVHSQPGQGTEISVEFPIPHDQYEEANSRSAG